MIYGNAGKSTTQRIFIVFVQTAIAAVAVWLLLFGGIAIVGSWFGADWSGGDLGRRSLLVLFVAVTYCRFLATILVLVRRAIGWEEAISVTFGFLLYYVGYALLGGSKSAAVGALDIFAVVLFLGGGTINTLSEVLRHRWRRQPQNSGKLYTGGLFRYSRHVNYFGDVLWVTAWAILSANWWSAIIPVAIFCFFAFYNAPLLDGHLASKYGEAFEAYRRRAKRLVPFLF